MGSAKVIGLAGLSGSGKTTLICALLPIFRARGLRVSTLKHAHHDFDVDRPGKDSYRHREMGAQEVVVSSRRRWALMHENRDAAEPELADLLARMSAVDWILVEGFKAENFPKVFLHRAAFRARLSPEDFRGFCGLIAVATDAPKQVDAAITLPRLDLNAPQSVVDFILDLPKEVLCPFSRSC